MLRNLLPAVGLSVILLTGASDTSARGCTWMGTHSSETDHMGWCWSVDEDHLSHCGSTGGCGMYHLAHWDLSDEDQARIQEIMSEARAEIEDILEGYDQDSSVGTTSHGCRCCH